MKGFLTFLRIPPLENLGPICSARVCVSAHIRGFDFDGAERERKRGDLGYTLY